MFGLNKRGVISRLQFPPALLFLQPYHELLFLSLRKRLSEAGRTHAQRPERRF